MNTIENTASQSATVEASKEKPMDKVIEKAQEAIGNRPSFKLMGRKVDIQDLETALETLRSDAGRIAKQAESAGYGKDVKNIIGGSTKVIDVPTVRKMAKDKLLGDPKKTAQRVADVVALNNLVDALVHLGVFKRN